MLNLISNFKFGKFTKSPFKNLAKVSHYTMPLTQWLKSQQANEQMTGDGYGLILNLVHEFIPDSFFHVTLSSVSVIARHKTKTPHTCISQFNLVAAYYI